MNKSIQYPQKYDVIVVGAGHAGCEAALAAARMGCQTLLLTINLDTIAFMSCNPAIGGPAKSQLVKEVDALGGQMGITTDLTYLQMKTLNTTKGPAVQALRAQSDKKQYHLLMKKTLEEQENLHIKQGLVEEILVDEEDNITGVKIKLDVIYRAKTVVITTGTFLRGKIHVGLKNMEAGRAGEFAANALSGSLKNIGLKLGRLKTGTPPRLDRRTIDFSNMIEQPGDNPPKHFSFSWEYTTPPDLEQVSCYLTHTNEKTHQIIKENLDRSPLYAGVIEGMGPRYCPSIEDKVVRFPDKERQQVFIEPEGRDTQEIYAQGLNTSLPEDVQLKLLRSMKGLENVEIMRPGYAVEYDFVYPEQLTYSLETKKIKGLFCAGQINGTSGYEEAAAQGLIAGINAAQKAKEEEPLILRRDDSYIGTMIDDLLTKEIIEPYRMLTSRSEYRLLLRQDNADMRLTEKGYEIGLVTEDRYNHFQTKKKKIEEEIVALQTTKVNPTQEVCSWINKFGFNLNKTQTLEELIKMPPIHYEDLISFLEPVSEVVPPYVAEQVEISLKYSGYIERQKRQIKKHKELEDLRLHEELDYLKLSGLRKEAQDKLQKIRPETLGQASRIAGVTPADISVLLIHLEIQRRRNHT